MAGIISPVGAAAVESDVVNSRQTCGVGRAGFVADAVSVFLILWGR